MNQTTTNMADVNDMSAPPLTLENVLKVVEGVKDWDGLKTSFGLPYRSISRQQYDSDEACVKGVVEKFLLGEGQYQPSWRRVIWSLDFAGEVDLSNKIRSFAEPVQDYTLTTDNIAEVFGMVNDLDLLAGFSRITGDRIIPATLLAAIRRKYNTRREVATKCAYYFSHCHHHPSWTLLATHLYQKGEFTAVEVVKPFLPLRDLTITTEKVTELFSTTNDVIFVDLVGFNLGIPLSKRDDIKNNYHSAAQRRDTYIDVYVNDHPCPSWRHISRALCGVLLDHEADVVDRTYVQVSEQTQHNFNEAMKDGEVWIRSGSSFMMGAGGSGKTCSIHAILEEKPPKIRQSTPFLKKPIRALAELKIDVRGNHTDKSSFVRITNEQFSEMLSMSAIWAVQTRPHQQRESDITVSQKVTVPPPQQLRDSISASSREQFEHTGFSRELLIRMNARSTSTLQLAGENLDEKNLLDMKDCGGQPMFHEILPVFVTNTMFGMLTVKLNEGLDSYPLVEYYTNGEPIGEPFKSPFTHIQTFHHCIKVLQSTCEHGKCPKIAIIGTHKDLEHECLEEDQAAKSQKLLRSIPPNMKKHVISCGTSEGSLLFPLNAICPGKDGQSVLARLREAMFTELLRVPRKRIPHRYFALEMAFQRLAKYLNKAILSIEECFKEAENFHFTRESFKDALKYLRASNLIIYYDEILPEVVFINAQVLLDKITELVKHSLMLHLKQCSQSSVLKSVEELQKFKSCGIITKDVLSRFRSGYIPNLFTEDDLISLFKYLRIVAEICDGEYLMPCLLRAEAISLTLSNSASHVVPSLVFYFGDDGPKLGVYCFLLSSLITDANWELLMENHIPVQLSRNQVHFRVPGDHPGFITINDSFSTFFYVDITFPSDISSEKAVEVCRDVCPSIRETIHTGIRNASRKLNYVYTDSIPKVAFLCLKHQTTSLHPATISSHGLLTCTSEPASVCSEMTERHKIWLGKGPSENTATATHQDVNTGHLSIADLGDVLEAIWEARTEWYDIGVSLRISADTLDAIKEDERGICNKCFREMLKVWLRRGKPQPKWTEMAKALRSPMVGYEQLAEKLPP